jgi:hypothetical protein
MFRWCLLLRSYTYLHVSCSVPTSFQRPLATFPIFHPLQLYIPSSEDHCSSRPNQDHPQAFLITTTRKRKEISTEYCDDGPSRPAIFLASPLVLSLPFCSFPFP